MPQNQESPSSQVPILELSFSTKTTYNLRYMETSTKPISISLLAEKPKRAYYTTTAFRFPISPTIKPRIHTFTPKNIRLESQRPGTKVLRPWCSRANAWWSQQA